MSEEQPRESVWPAVRLVVLVVAGMIVGNVLVTLLMTRDTGLGPDEALAFGGGAALGLLIEFALFRRKKR
ncbi:hypothetical protein [Nonomuraea zeae]|uniref:Uncharacterized protein n=1 Tax=Nonomuraea zeae TaxID=1642303 RepID=A0A5S4GF51_9ACTN|nr:hypothetical protein [Nonomuraea zeae]TMR31608.1 hypothetical protein ETD85_25415 [Nonomuraea zeae]